MQNSPLFWDRQPTEFTRVRSEFKNLGLIHALMPGLQFASNLYDYSNPNNPSPAIVRIQGDPRVSTPNGMAMQFHPVSGVNGDAQESANSTKNFRYPVYINPNDDLTVIWLGYVDTPGGTANGPEGYGSLWALGADGEGNGWGARQIAYSNGNLSAFYIDSSPAQFATPLAIPGGIQAKQFIAAGYRKIGGSGRVTSFDGINRLSATTTQGNGTMRSSSVGFDLPGSGQNPTVPAGNISWTATGHNRCLIALVFKRALTDQQIFDILSNPYQIFEKEQSQQVYYSAAQTTTVSKDLSATYDIKSSVTKSLSASYGIFNSVAKSLSATYGINNFVAKSLTANYGIFNSVVKSLSATYGIYNSVARNLSANYFVLGSVSKQLAASYSILTSVSKNLNASYGINNYLAKNLAVSYGINNYVAKSLVATYGVYGKVQKDLAASYSINSSTSISKQLVVSYGINNFVSKNLSPSYGISSSVAKSISANYGIVSYVARSLNANYNVGNGIGKSLSASYEINNYVAKSLAASYSINAKLIKDLSCNYLINSSTSISKQLSASYGIYGSIAKNISAAYAILSSVSKSFDSVYLIRSAVSKSLVANYGITGLVAKDLSASYSVQGTIRLIKSLSALYSIRGPVVLSVGNVYRRQIENAKRQIAAKGQIIEWQQSRLVLIEGSQPWKPKREQTLKTSYYPKMVFLPISREKMQTIVAMNGAEEIGSGAFMGLMGAVDFEPSEKDIVLRNGVTLDIQSIDLLSPNGEKILYTVIFKG